MAHSWDNPDDFLALLNSRVYWEDDEVRARDEDEFHGQQTLPLDTRARFVFTTQVDFVIQGLCSDMTGWTPTDALPMGGLLGEPKRSWLHAIIGEQPQTILLFSDCCGSYSLEYQNMLRRLFPQITWLFPVMGDLYNNFPATKNVVVAAHWLMEAGIIGPEKKGE